MSETGHSGKRAYRVSILVVDKETRTLEVIYDPRNLTDRHTLTQLGYEPDSELSDEQEALKRRLEVVAAALRDLLHDRPDEHKELLLELFGIAYEGLDNGNFAPNVEHASKSLDDFDSRVLSALRNTIGFAAFKRVLVGFLLLGTSVVLLGATLSSIQLPEEYRIATIAVIAQMLLLGLAGCWLGVTLLVFFRSTHASWINLALARLKKPAWAPFVGPSLLLLALFSVGEAGVLELTVIGDTALNTLRSDGYVLGVGVVVGLTSELLLPRLLEASQAAKLSAAGVRQNR